MVPANLDHIVIAVPDLSAAQESFRTVLGLESVGGGRHDGAGTENSIVPLQDCYLELVTVVDPAAAATNPFGRLVSFALQHRLLFAGWAIGRSPAADARLSHQRLTRHGVAVDLYGVDEVVGASHRPFFLVRPPHQARPGAELTPAAQLVGMSVARPGMGPAVALSHGDPLSAPADDSRRGYLAAVELRLPDGSARTLTYEN